MGSFMISYLFVSRDHFPRTGIVFGHSASLWMEPSVIEEKLKLGNYAESRTSRNHNYGYYGYG